jgi:hypothetical protein
MKSFINTKRRLISIDMNNSGFYNYLIKRNKRNSRNNKVSSLFKQINKSFQKDKDKMNIENSNLFSYFYKPNFENIYNKKKYKSIPNKTINKFYKAKDFLDQSINTFKNTELLFRNKFIRNKNKNQYIYINSIGPEIPLNNLLKVKDNEYKTKYQIIKDNNHSNRFDKNKILDILKFQTKSNFNNKYKLIFKSSDNKKRNLIKNYFSLIKKNLKEEYKAVETPKKNLDKKKETNINMNINRDFDLFYNINKTCISNYKFKSKRLLRTIPILINSKFKKEDIKEEKDVKYKSIINASKNDYNENDETFSFYSTKNPIFQTETNIKKKYYYK